MLKKLFGSGARVKLLRQFLENQDQEFFIRELTRILDEQINSLRRELENLEAIGLLKSTERNRRKFYRVNPHFHLLHELTSVIRKTNEGNDDFLKKLSKLGDLDILVLSGAFLGQTGADADVFIVGGIDKDKVQTFIDTQFPDQKIKYVLMTREDFLYRITLSDKFVQKVFSDKDNIVLKNKLKKDTEALVRG